LYFWGLQTELHSRLDRGAGGLPSARAAARALHVMTTIPTSRPGRQFLHRHSGAGGAIVVLLPIYLYFLGV